MTICLVTSDNLEEVLRGASARENRYGKELRETVEKGELYGYRVYARYRPGKLQWLRVDEAIFGSMPEIEESILGNSTKIWDYS